MECGKTFNLREIVYQCKKCGGLPEVEYDLESIGETTSPSNLTGRKIYSMWRYSEFLLL